MTSEEVLKALNEIRDTCKAQWSCDGFPYEKENGDCIADLGEGLRPAFWELCEERET